MRSNPSYYRQFNMFSKFSEEKEAPKLTIIPAPSPYFTNQTITPYYILLHCIGYEDPLEVLNANNVSCHYLIPEQKSSNKLIAYEVVKPPLRAWHAGISQWKNYINLNDYAIGIEINMPNYAHALENSTLDFLYFENYQAQQISALEILVKQIQQMYSIPPENILAHSDVAAWRNISGTIEISKTDPGPTLPWQALAQKDIGVWPAEDCPDSVKTNLTASQLQKLLSEVGYNVPQTGVYDLATNLSMGAARLHWEKNCFNSYSGSANNCYTKPADPELACSLYNLGRGNYARSSHSGSSNSLIILLAAASPIVILFLAFALYKLYTSRNNRRFQPASDSPMYSLSIAEGPNSQQRSQGFSLIPS